MLSRLRMNCNTEFCKRAFTRWVGVGAFLGAWSGGRDKIDSICSEQPLKYRDSFIERKIQMMYYSTRVIAHCGYWAFIGGFAAATAPISIPIYMCWRERTQKANLKEVYF